MTSRLNTGRSRRGAAVLAAGIVAAALAGAPTAGASAGTNSWAQNGGTFGHAGVNAGERALGPATVGRLAPSWTLSTGSLHNIPGTTTARVVSGTAYVVADDDTVYAINSHTGAVRWTTSLSGTTPFQQPLVQDGVLVVQAGCCTLESPSTVVGLNAATGHEMWSRAISPISLGSATGHSLFLGAEPDGEHPSLTRLDLRTGRSLWTVTSTDPGDFGWDLTALDRNLVISEHLHGFASADIEARRLSNGRSVWTSALPGTSPVAHGIAIARHQIYVVYFRGSSRRLRSLTDTGRVRWDVPAGPATRCDNLNEERPSVSDSVVLLPCGGQMSAYSSVSGHRRWTRTLGSFVTNAAIANGVWYAGWLNFPAAQNRLGAFRVSNGRQLWRAATSQALLDLVQEEGPAVAEGRVFWSFNNTTLRTYALP